MHTICLEEHFATDAFFNGPGKQLKQRTGMEKLVTQLMDIGEGRISLMDAAGIDIQILSLTSPGVEQLNSKEAVILSRETNDILAAAIKNNPSRFAGFASLPTSDPKTAADELERVVLQHGFKGAMINGHNQGHYLDQPLYWSILERAEALGVPIYLHPTPPPQNIIDTSYTGNFPPVVTALFASAGWGWHIETALHLIRIILGGVFDRFPKLQFIVGHMGETLPFMIPRLDLGFPKSVTGLQRTISQYLCQNVHYTFGGFNWTPTFLDLVMQVGVSRIMFSTDYPYGSMEEARAFLDRLPVSSADRECIAHGNAERLFAL